MGCAQGGGCPTYFASAGALGVSRSVEPEDPVRGGAARRRFRERSTGRALPWGDQVPASVPEPSSAIRARLRRFALLAYHGRRRTAGRVDRNAQQPPPPAQSSGGGERLGVPAAFQADHSGTDEADTDEDDRCGFWNSRRADGQRSGARILRPRQRQRLRAPTAGSPQSACGGRRDRRANSDEQRNRGSGTAGAVTVSEPGPDSEYT